MERLRKRALLSIIGLALVSIAFVQQGKSAPSKSNLVETWYDRTYTQVPLKKILIIGLSKDDATRRLFEYEFSSVLLEKGITATPSMSLIPVDKGMNRDTVVQTLKDSDFDSVMVSRLIGVDTQTNYVPGTKQQRAPQPDNRYSSFDDDYKRTYDTVYTPGYLLESKTVKIETEIYSKKTQKLIWSGTSETVDPNSKGDLIRSLGSTIARDLSGIGFISRPKKQ